MLLSFVLIYLGSTECPYTGAEWNPTGNPIGGGPGYGDSVRHQDADYFVSTKSELLSALISASYGDIVYIADWAEIDMDGSTGMIPAGVTLASGRGRTLGDTISWGALCYFDSINYEQWEMFQFTGRKGRITGLRLRGAYSELEGRSGNHSFPQPVAAEAGVSILRDSCEVDNCEMWGFGYCPVYCNDGDGSYVHHNYFHHGSHVYHGYGFSVGYSGKVVLEANYWDCFGGTCGGGGANSLFSKYEARYNIVGRRAGGHAFDRHGTGHRAAADYIHHNTVRFDGYVSGGVTGYHVFGIPVDSVLIHNNWFWSSDSASSIKTYHSSDSMCRFSNNHFTKSPPEGLSSRLPVANIFASTDSGSPPLTVTFKAWGSYDPDGNLRAFYWNFGDSSGVDNYARYTDILDSVQHTFHEIGIYRVELMVTDDAGIPAVAYRDINVAPTDGRNWLSVWVKDRYHGDKKGYYSVKILIDDWTAWEKDIAGEDGWEHVIIDVTDSLFGEDSVTVAFRFNCDRDTNLFEPIGVMTLWDDLVIYGANVINGNFETGPWDGTAERSDGYWIPSRTMHYYCWDYCASVRSGVRSYSLVRMYYDVANAGDYCQVEQKVTIGPISTTGQDQDSVVFYVTQNPALKSALIAYQTPVRSDISMRIYDTNGRLVKTLLDKTQESGFYETHWDGRDNHSRNVANGIYFCKFIAEPVDSGEGYYETKKVVYLH